MNKKLLKASLATLAAVALVGGGSTLAAFSDFQNVNGNSVTAGTLRLDINNENGGTVTPINVDNAYPGQDTSATPHRFMLTNNSGSDVNADLSITLTNLQTSEGIGCSSNSELAADTNCTQPGDTGEAQNRIELVGATEQVVGGVCDPSTRQAFGNAYTPDAVNHGAYPITNLSPGESICFTIATLWPVGTPSDPADNAAQGDSFTFDAHFDLVQS